MPAPAHRRHQPCRVRPHPARNQPRSLNPSRPSRLVRLHRLGHPVNAPARGHDDPTHTLNRCAQRVGGKGSHADRHHLRRGRPASIPQSREATHQLFASAVDAKWTRSVRHERSHQKPINGFEQRKTKSPLSDSNRRPLPYHGRVRVLRAFTDALGRARNPCKQPAIGVYGRGGRFTVVVDLVDAEWTRCSPPFVFRISRADTGPRRAGGGGPPGPPDAGLTRSTSARRRTTPGAGVG